MVNYLLKNKSMVEEKKERKHTDYYRHFPEERSQAAFQQVAVHIVTARKDLPE